MTTKLTTLLVKPMRRPTTSAKRSAAEVSLIQGYRSGLEDVNVVRLRAQGVPFAYEEFKIPWVLHKECTYTPDFLLPNGIIVETKGRFVTSDRQKHLAIQKQEPDLDIRFVFSRSKAFLAKGSKTTYGDWCATKGLQFTDSVIPAQWWQEPVNEASLARVRELFLSQKKPKDCPF
jgi:hypothetical protein